jgi:anti-sigma factor RsiW
MTCRDLQHLLHPYSDGELDLVRRVEIEEHLAGCGACAEHDKHLRSLRATVSSPSLYYRAPAALRARLRAAAPRETGRFWRSRLGVAAAAAGVLFLIGASAIAGMLFARRAISADDRLTDLVVAGHVRSLQVSHLRDVASSDRHTVKPWLVDKLDFSPQVPDLSAQGYELSGGRLDYLADRPVAALVYNRALHTINVFTWPAAGSEDRPVRAHLRQGFHIRDWIRSGMTYWAISDLNDSEFDEFVRLFQEHS